MQKDGLIRKIRLVSKFMTSQAGQQVITIHTLPNISKSKDNQATKFGQLTEYNVKGIRNYIDVLRQKFMMLFLSVSS